MTFLLQNIRADLKVSIDPQTLSTFQRFFKEKVLCYGVKTAVVRKIAKKYWQEIKHLGKAEIFALCEELLKSDYTEEAFVVAEWLPNLVDRFERSDLALFESWIEKYINNWAKCDSFCNHTLGDFIEKYPDAVKELKRWARSKNRWLRRAAAVSLILPARKGEFLTDIFEIADRLITDPDDLVQKGYGWMLKEASRTHQHEVFQYVVNNRQRMPRTALRYAIELMPKALKAEAMKKIS